jgi:2,4-dienoyl-CoA reductase (NADPH2)
MIKGTEVEPIPDIVKYYKAQFKKLGVNVRLNTKVTEKTIDEDKPDAVIIASGGSITTPDIPGITSRKVVSNKTLHKSAKFFLRFFSPGFLRWMTNFYLPFGKRVVVIGGLIHGLEMAEFLVKRGKQVAVVETSGQLGSGMHDINKNRLIPWLQGKGVTMLTGIKYKAVTDRGLTIINSSGEEQTLDADSIAIATMPDPDDTLFNKLKGLGKEAYIIGDARESRTILDAIHEGFRVGREI